MKRRSMAMQIQQSIVLFVLVILAAGCAFAPRTKLDRSREYNTDLSARLERNQAELAQHQRELADASQSISRLEKQITTGQEVRTILNQRVVNLRRENDRLRTDLAGAVMTVAGEAPYGGGIVNAGHTQFERFTWPDGLESNLTSLASKMKWITFVPEERVIRFASDHLFRDGSNEVTQQGRAALRELGQLFSRADFTAINFSIVGHTSTRSEVETRLLQYHPTGWHLAAHQAIAVQHELEEFGVSPVRVGVASYSSYQPLVNGTDDVAHSANARVEIYLLAPDPPVK